MSKIRVLSDHIANQIAAGEVVERPASVAKELVENSIDAGARRIEIDVEAGGRKLLRVSDDGEGMTRDDAVLAFERHATSKISKTEDLERIATLGFRGEALASIASVARVELITQTEGEGEATRVLIEGGRMRDVGPAARPRGTTIVVRDLFFNVPARRKFLRSEATESFHLTNLVTHYALAHPEIAFSLTNNGRETLRAAPAADLRERAYQIFGAGFLENLLELGGEAHGAARVRGYVSAPRERRTTRDSQYLFVNGRFVRDRLLTRSLSDGYRSVLPHGAYPAALLFLEVPPEEVDVNVHPAKTEVRFRRAPAVADAVREAVRVALSAGGFLRPADGVRGATESSSPDPGADSAQTNAREPSREQESMEFGWAPPADDIATPTREAAEALSHTAPIPPASNTPATLQTQRAPTRDARAADLSEVDDKAVAPPRADDGAHALSETRGQSPAQPEMSRREDGEAVVADAAPKPSGRVAAPLPPLDSVAGFVREVAAESLSPNIRPLGQLGESFIIATDAEGLLLIDQHVAHERILFDKYRDLEASRRAESQQLLVPETFDLTPAQTAVFETVAEELEHYGFELMRLSGRTVAIKCVPADLPAGEARNMLSEILDTVDAERRGARREGVRDRIAASLARRAAVKNNTPLTQEKMSWLIERLLLTSSPTTSTRGRPVILRLTKRDLERGFHRP
jgi:DNA mismatch repair protein MutL